MSGTATLPPRLQPPAHDPPITDDGRHSSAWSGYFQRLADRLETVSAKMGVTDGTEALAGQVGEFQSLHIPSSAAITMANFGIIDVAALLLQPGDWDVWGNVIFMPGGTTTINTIACWINPVSVTPAIDDDSYVTIRGSLLTGNHQALATGHRRLLNTAAQYMYLSATAGFAVSTMVAYGWIHARRAR